jgi:hypothetical protein
LGHVKRTEPPTKANADKLSKNFPDRLSGGPDEDPHRYRGNGAVAIATLRTAALILLRLAGIQSIRTERQTVMHAITALVARSCANHSTTRV